MLTPLSLPDTFIAGGYKYQLRRAQAGDLDTLVVLLADDPISATRGDAATEENVERYKSAFAEIVAEPSNELVVAVKGRDIVATLQLTRIPGLTRRGATRLIVESVRVKDSERSKGLGTALMHWVLTTAAQALEVDLVQLTTDAERTGARRFYARLGFTESHVGLKFPIVRHH